MTGDMVKNARVGYGGTFNEPLVSLDLTGRGGRVFGKLVSATARAKKVVLFLVREIVGGIRRYGHPANRIFKTSIRVHHRSL